MSELTELTAARLLDGYRKGECTTCPRTMPGTQPTSGEISTRLRR
ncbi:hypothetical protein [Streptomyces pseudogriseolus]